MIVVVVVLVVAVVVVVLHVDGLTSTQITQLNYEVRVVLWKSEAAK